MLKKTLSFMTLIATGCWCRRSTRRTPNRIKAARIAQRLEEDLTLTQFLERLLQITAVDVLERIGRREFRFFG